MELDLSGFTGSESYYRFSGIFKNFLLTDGAQYLAENAGCFWLMDAIASHMRGYHDVFAVAKLVRSSNGWLLTLDDGNNRVWAGQHIEFSDFPLSEIKLYVCKSDEYWVIMLPSEY